MSRPAPTVLAAIEAALTGAIDLVASSLTADQRMDVFHLLDHNEAGLALDTLCSHLYEHDVVIDDETRQLIAHAGLLMGDEPPGVGTVGSSSAPRA